MTPWLLAPLSIVACDPVVALSVIEDPLAPGLHARLHPHEGETDAAWLVLPGASGTWPDYDHLADGWSSHADVLVLDYYDGGADVDPDHVLDPTRQAWEAWVDNGREAVRWLREVRGATCVGVIGMSRGGTLAYALGADDQQDATVLVHAVPRSDHRGEREADVTARLDQDAPLVHYTGRADGFLDPAEAERWHQELLDRGVDAALHVLEGGPHGYMLGGFPEVYDAAAAEATSEGLVDFLNERC